MSKLKEIKSFKNKIKQKKLMCAFEKFLVECISQKFVVI